MKTGSVAKVSQSWKRASEFIINHDFLKDLQINNIRIWIGRTCIRSLVGDHLLINAASEWKSKTIPGENISSSWWVASTIYNGSGGKRQAKLIELEL